MNKTLEEIIKVANKALETMDEVVANLPVDHITKTAHISVAGSFDSIILLAEDALIVDPTQDAVDRPERHSIAGHMNDPSDMQEKAFDKNEK